MRDLIRGFDRHDGAPRRNFVHRAPAGSTATDLLTGIVATDSREQRHWSTTSGVLAAYRTDGAMESTRAPQLDLDTFCDGANTLYICSSGRQQRQFARSSWPPSARSATPSIPLPAGRATDRTPTLFALDEVANIAPVPDLPVHRQGGSWRRVYSFLACLQDLSQARGRWGSAADGFLSLFGTTVVLPGIADTRTLRDVSALAGDHEVPVDLDSPARPAAGALPRASSSVGLPTRTVPRLPGRRRGPRRGSELLPSSSGHATTSREVRLTPAHECSAPGGDRLGTPLAAGTSGRPPSKRPRAHAAPRPMPTARSLGR